MLENKEDRNKLRSVVVTAEEKAVISKEEGNFIVALVSKYRNEIEKKIKQLHVLQGEISQLKSNEAMIIDLVESLVLAAERDLARQETMSKLKEGRVIQEERRRNNREKISDSKED